jgi:protein phosphatase
VACAWVHGNQLYTATVGDSRIYLARGGSIRQLSVDHTWVQEALEMGVLHPDQVNGHPNAHVIRRYLGSPEPPEVDLRMRLARNEADSQAVANQGVQLRPGDRLLLCSDGLTDLVSDAEILAILQRTPLSHATEALTALANQRGGHDNITIITAQVKGEPKEKRRFNLLQQIPLLIVFGLLVAGLITFYIICWVQQLGEQVVPTATPTVSLLLEATELPTVPSPTFASTLTPVMVGTPSLQVDDDDELQTPIPAIELEE